MVFPQRLSPRDHPGHKGWPPGGHPQDLDLRDQSCWRRPPPKRGACNKSERTSKAVFRRYVALSTRVVALVYRRQRARRRRQGLAAVSGPLHIVDRSDKSSAHARLHTRHCQLSCTLFKMLSLQHDVNALLAWRRPLQQACQSMRMVALVVYVHTPGMASRAVQALAVDWGLAKAARRAQGGVRLAARSRCESFTARGQPRVCAEVHKTGL